MAVQKKFALGRGLDALISNEEVQTSGSSNIGEIELSKIFANPNQPRREFDPIALQELADSISEVGIIQPITLRKINDDSYQIIAGERRYKASALAGLKTIPAYIKTADDENVKAVVLRVNSGGGSAYASEQIWHSVKKLTARKPVVVSMGGMAASGAYYLSAGANYVFAEPTTLTGSIGIFGIIPDVSGLLKDKLGLRFDGVKTNRHADFFTTSRPLDEAEKSMLQSYVDRGYDLFVKRVADGRRLSEARVREIAQGRVYTGEDALKIRLVDRLGTLDDAVAEAAKRAKVSEYGTVHYPKQKTWFEQLVEEKTG